MSTTSASEAKLRSLLHYSGLPISSAFIVEGVLAELQQAAAEKVGILSGKVSEFVDETLDREDVESDFDPAPRSPRSTALDRHIRHTEVLCRVGLIDGSPELVGLRLPGILLADDGGVGHAVGPCNEVSLLINAAAKAVHAGGAVAVMSEIVFASPDELDRPLDMPRDLHCLVIKRYAEAAPQTSPHEGDVDGDVALVDAEKFGSGLLGSSAGLGG